MEEKVYGYARKSPDDKEDTDISINNQIELIEDVCKKKEWKLVKVFVDKNISGGDRFRKGFIDMMSNAIDNKIKILVTKNQDRFARDHAFFSDTLMDLDARDIKVYSIMKSGFLSHEDLGDVVTSVVNAYQIIDNRKKARLLQEQKKEKGLPSIPAPYGYRYSKSKNQKMKIWFVDRRRAEVVVEVFRDRKKGINYKDTIKRLQINTPLYYRIIKNIDKGLYNGYIVYERKIKDANKKVIKLELIKYKGTHEPIIEDV